MSSGLLDRQQLCSWIVINFGRIHFYETGIVIGEKSQWPGWCHEVPCLCRSALIYPISLFALLSISRRVSLPMPWTIAPCWCARSLVVCLQSRIYLGAFPCHGGLCRSRPRWRSFDKWRQSNEWSVPYSLVALVSILEQRAVSYTHLTLPTKA